MYFMSYKAEKHESLYHSKLNTQDFHWIVGSPPESQRNLKAKTRYRQEDQPCSILQIDDQSFEVSFTEPQWAITPGQSVVLYQDDICLGGGIINKRYN